MSNQVKSTETRTTPKSSLPNANPSSDAPFQGAELTEASALGPFLWLAIPFVLVMAYGFFGS